MRHHEVTRCLLTMALGYAFGQALLSGDSVVDNRP